MVPGVTVDNNTINVNGNNVTLTLSWEEPFNNLYPIMNYTVSCSGDDTCPPNFTTTDNTTRSYTITNLTPMTNYTFSVVATNSIGNGKAGVVMITSPPEEIITTIATSTTSTTITTTTSTSTTVISTVDTINITTTDSVITITSSPSSVAATFSSIAPVSSSIIMSSKNDYYRILQICYKAIKIL